MMPIVDTSRDSTIERRVNLIKQILWSVDWEKSNISGALLGFPLITGGPQLFKGSLQLPHWWFKPSY